MPVHLHEYLFSTCLHCQVNAVRGKKTQWNTESLNPRSGLVTKSCLTLATPGTVALQALLSMGFPRQEYWTGLPFPSLEDLSDPGIEPMSLALQADSSLSGYYSSVKFSHSGMSNPASLSITNSWSPPKPMSMVLVMPSNHLILCRPLLLLPSIFPSIRIFSNESLM